SARGTSVLNNIDMDEEYLSFDNIYDITASGKHTEDLTQSARKEVQVPQQPSSSDPPSPTGQENLDDDAKTKFLVDILVSDNATTLVMENFIPDIKELKIWEIRVKSLIK
ncbi:hypothetical protein KI387_042040, partial [Taxus chinensis]